MARGEISPEVKNREQLQMLSLQILEGGRNVHDGIETILSQLNPKVVYFGDDMPEAFEGMGLTAVAELGTLKAELKRSSANHTTILVSEAFLNSLAEKSQDAKEFVGLSNPYPILRYSEQDRRESDRTVVLVAELMASSLEILREHYRLPEQHETVNGNRFRFYDAGDLKKALADLLTEYQARIAVARAA